ncbi:MAG: DHH family phosphoesterase, partial [Clostridia bacterium]|nr:DHH family phosphoesterase [Clostridia bacterium]
VTSVLAILILLAAAASTVVLYSYNTIAGIVQLIVFLVLIIAYFVFWFSKKRYYDSVVKAADKYFASHGGAESYPMPVAVVGKNGTIVWYNDLFRVSMMGNNLISSGKISEFIGDVPYLDVCKMSNGMDLTYDGRMYTVYAGEVDEKTGAALFFFLDNTELKRDAGEYRQSKPCVIYMRLDNQEDVFRHYKSSECEAISSGIENIFETWASEYPCIMKKLSSDRYYVIMEERGLTEIMEDKFDILKKIREYKFGESFVEMTVSIGAGRGRSLPESDSYALSALEMSQSRGGDQATVNTDGTLDFFGGLVGRTTTSSRVKSRIMAANLSEQIRKADMVFVTGHKFTDLDSVGSCIGVTEFARVVGRPSFVLINRQKSLAPSLIEHYIDKTGNDIFINDKGAEALMRGKRCLLIVCDTHRSASLEYPELTGKFDAVAIIDHHRRTTDMIEGADLYYMEANASSACELVTELLQYIPVQTNIQPAAANALLSGIMLDTRNFVLGTGVRTFEAAAWLKGAGADTVAVKQLFANSIDNYKAKASILSTVSQYKDCAFAVSTELFPNMRIIASQVADELLSVSGVKSSYVLIEEDGSVFVSARSLGDMNVQWIMEQLGGGGHFTMAAAQRTESHVPETIEALKKAIDAYLEMQ